MADQKAESKPVSLPSSTKSISYYDILELSPDCSNDDIKKAYRRQALRLHPDKNLGEEERAKRDFQKVQEAFEVLNSPEGRLAYDKKINKKRSL